MITGKSKGLKTIEERMGTLDPDSMRYRVLDKARDFKSSWIELGQALYAVHQDKLFKGWGYLTFDAYCAKELGLRQPTAVKLLKSYYFLEQKEPAFLKRARTSEQKPSEIPSMDSVNVLRLASQNEKIPGGDYEKLREDVLDNGKEEKEVKQKVRYLLKSHAKPLSPEEKEERRGAVLGRLLLAFRNAKSQLQEFSFPDKVTKKLDEVIDLLEDFQK
jgi:hypothetical protein